MQINIPQICGDDIISRDAGKKIRDLILANWDEDEIRLIVAGRTVGSVSFFDEAIGLLMKRGNKSPNEVLKKLKFPDLKPEDKTLLNYVFATRNKEFLKK